MPETRIAVLVTAAGRSERFGSVKKEFVRVEGRSVLDLAVSAFLSLPGLAALAVTSPPERESETLAALSADTKAALERLGPGRFLLVAGGGTRRDSVRLGLEALAGALDIEPGAASEAAPGAAPEAALRAAPEAIVLVHDGARPWASERLALRVARATTEHGAVVPLVPLVDTPKQTGPDGTILGHPRRDSIGAAQTPQGFLFGPLLAAHRRAAAEDRAAAEGRAPVREYTDDAELWAAYVGPVDSIEGELGNKKITVAGDLPGGVDEAGSGGGAVAAAPFRIGQGWDIHRLVPGRPLVLGGRTIPSDLGEDGHSDGDVLLHAVIDALLGAVALGDIGQHFPPSDEAWRGADSRDLAARAAALVRSTGWEPVNVDCTVVLERPRLGPYRDAMRESIAAALGIDAAAVSVKAKTKEGLDAVGEGRAVEAQAIVLVAPRRSSVAERVKIPE
ncbi:MAG: 2-C-methyl-D-erythritol 2,4-cyclodiphosphate synthase [Spirochaetaceae bacterium]|nr:2-C-methyl-D-erythritol 2,4-cyclodiphosphate synthase [Spirochaetaceae bacterium]